MNPSLRQKCAAQTNTRDVDILARNMVLHDFVSTRRRRASRIAQWDILEFVRDPGHISPDFPDGYWQEVDAMATPAGWQKTIKEFTADLESFLDLVKNPKTDFFSPYSPCIPNELIPKN